MSSFVIATPEVLVAASTDLADIRSAMSAASGAASVPTTQIAAAASDEVSVSIARLFGSFGQEYQVQKGADGKRGPDGT